MKRIVEIGGFIAGAIMIAFGVAVIALGFSGRSTVNDSLRQEQIVGTPDMTPALITAEAKKAGLAGALPIPSCSVANVAITSGAQARCFAQYMVIHTLEASGGLYYSQLPRYASANGKGTNDATKALKANGQPLDNPARNTWITETALTTALNVSYTADRLSLFSVVVGFALLLAGIGFGILDYAALDRRRKATEVVGKAAMSQPGKPVVA